MPPLKKRMQMNKKNDGRIIPEYLNEAVNYIDNWLWHQKLISPHTPGFSIAISYRGNIVFKKAYGFANLAHKEEMTPDHLFRIASHSKTFTATAIMQLMDEGKLNIHEPASLYLPFLKDNPDKRMQKVTIQQMLAHSSGMGRDGEDPSFWRLQKDFPSENEMIDYFKNEPLVLESNTRFKYSNYAYALLGWIVEKVSGKTYTSYIKDHILNPLDIESIGGEYDVTKGPYITGYTGITPDGTQRSINAAINTNKISSATGFFSTAENLCFFYDAIMPGSGKLLSDELKNEMLRQQWIIPDEEIKRGYALGFVCEELSGYMLNGHSGGMPGNITKTLFDKNEKIVVSVLTNSLLGSPDLLQAGIWHIFEFFKKNYKGVSPYSKYYGQFYDMWFQTNFVPLGNKIYVTNPTTNKPFQQCSNLEHYKENIFKITKEGGYGSYGENVEFIMDQNEILRVIYAGYPLQNKDNYLKYLQTIS